MRFASGQLLSRRSARLSPMAAALAAGIIAGSLMLSGGPAGAFGRKLDPNSPFTPETQAALNRAASTIRRGGYQKGAVMCQNLLDSATDVAKCIAIAEITEPGGLPLTETRRACLTKAYQLAQTRDDMILVALKARKYSFFEVTRQAVQSLVTNARTVKDLYDLANKAQEVALNDVAHLAMEKAYTGIKAQQEAFTFAEQCKALGMEDLLRKVVKELLDDEDEVIPLCDMIERLNGYNLRDMTRYGLRKAMDNAKTTEEMQAIFEVARRTNEGDIANRANYFVRKGNIIKQIKKDRAEYQAKIRAWREGIDLDSARAQDPSLTTSDTTATAKKKNDIGTGF